jgi:hypothetical protein
LHKINGINNNLLAVDIKKDIEFIDNQVTYLDRYHQNILIEWNKIKGWEVQWNGLPKDHLIYLQLDRWLTCYNELKKHLQDRTLADEKLLEAIRALPPFVYSTIPPYSDFKFSKVKETLQRIIFPLRLKENKKNIKNFIETTEDMGELVYRLKKIRYALESYYYDGV